MRYPLESGGKRVRPVISLAVTEAAGAVAEHCLPAAAAVELVHTFSLVHDDLPAMDDDDERRGRPSAHVAFDEATALLAGDALLVEAFRLALSYPTPMVGRELAEATLAMIGGQYRDVTGDTADLAALHRLKTGALFSAAVGVALWVAEVPEADAARVARVRRRARPALPARRRPARRRRLRGGARGGGGARARGRGGDAPKSGSMRSRPTQRARGHRRRPRRPHGLSGRVSLA